MNGKHASADISEASTYNLKAVVLETGIKPDTLRAWERRYSLPNPARTSGGHRLYSQRDIETLKWLTARQDEGLSISRAVALWNKLSEEGNDPLIDMPLAQTEVAEVNTVVAGDTLLNMRRAWIDACLAYDEAKAEAIVAQAFSLYPPETVVFDLFQQGLAEIGMGWFEGRITAQQEHFASALAMRRLDNLVAAAPPATRPGRIVVGCPPEEEHTFAPLLITYILRRRGYEALYLGANVPLARIEATLTATKPDLVIFSAQTLHTASTLLDMAEILHNQDVNIAYGGLVFNNRPRLRRMMPGHFLGTRIDEVPLAVERIMGSPRLLDARYEPSLKYQEAHTHFQSQLAHLESRVWELMRDTPVAPTVLARSNRDFARTITAALRLGEIELVGTDLHWIQALLTNYHYRMPAQRLGDYLEAYHRAASDSLDDRGQLIVDWLSGILES